MEWLTRRPTQTGRQVGNLKNRVKALNGRWVTRVETHKNIRQFQ